MEIDKEKEFIPKKWPQIYAAGAASMAGLALGATLAWPSPNIKSLVESNDIGVISKDTESWIVSIVMLGALVSGPVAGFGIEKLGRKTVLILLTAPFVLSNLLIAFSTNVGMILTGRFLAGFCAGLGTLAAPTYITEIATNSIRGTLGSIFNATLTLGTVMTFLLGDVTDWVWMTLIHAAIPLIMLIGMIFVPESPIYLIMKGQLDEARKSLVWLRGADNESQIEPELQLVKKRIDEYMSKVQKTKLTDLFKDGVWQPTLIAFALVSYNQLSGITAMLSYSASIVSSTNSDMSPNLVSAVLGCVAISSTFFMDKAGRIPLLMISEIGMSLSFIVLGVFYYLQQEDEDGRLEGAITWMPLVALFTYNLFYNIGLGPLPRIIATEILPQHVKGLTLSLALGMNWILAFAVTRTFQILLDGLKSSGFFWLYAGICISGAVIIFFVVPETKGKSLAEIENRFKRKGKNDVEIAVMQ